MVPQGRPLSNDSPQQTQHIACGTATAQADQSIAEALKPLLQTPASAWAQHGLLPGPGQGWWAPSFRGCLGSLAVGIDLFREDSLAARASSVVSGSRAQRRYHLLRELMSLGLPAVRPLAYGALTAGDERASCLVWQFPAGAQPWTWNSPAAALQQTGRMLRQLHDLGLRVPDLGPEDLGIDGAGRVFWARVRSLQQSGTASSKLRAAVLACFCGALDGGPLDPTAADLLAAYQQPPEQPQPTALAMPDGWREDLALASRRWRRAALLAAGRACMSPGGPVGGTVRRRGQARWLWQQEAMVAGMPDWNDAEQRREWEAWFQRPPQPQKSGRRGAVWLQDRLVVKQREEAAAAHLWQAMHWLRWAGVATPGPLALCRHRGRGFVLTQRLQLESLAAELSAGSLSAAQRRNVAASLGAEVGRLHAHGLRNRDLKLENLIRDPADGRVHQVDLDGVRRKANLDTRGVGNDLGRLLAAYVAAGTADGHSLPRAFLRAWLRSHRKLLLRPPVRRILQQAARRAAEWQQAHSK